MYLVCGKVGNRYRKYKIGVIIHCDIVYLVEFNLFKFSSLLINTFTFCFLNGCAKTNMVNY